MMPEAGDPVALKRNHHLRELENGVISGRKATVRRELWNARVFKITLDDVAEIVNLLWARAVRLDALLPEQVFPGHPVCQK